jgi:hypothetical protein
MREMSWLGPDGRRYQVSITDNDGTGRSPAFDNLVFAQEDSAWKATIPIRHGITLVHLFKEDLERLWERAGGKG